MEWLSSRPAHLLDRTFFRLLARLCAAACGAAPYESLPVRRILRGAVMHALSLLRRASDQDGSRAQPAFGALAVILTSTASMPELWDEAIMRSCSEALEQSLRSGDPAVAEAGTRALAAVLSATQRETPALAYCSMTVLPSLVHTAFHSPHSDKDMQKRTVTAVLAAYDSLDAHLKEGYASLKLALVLGSLGASKPSATIYEAFRERLMAFIATATRDSQIALKTLPVTQRQRVLMLTQGHPTGQGGNPLAVPVASASISLKSF